MGKELGLAAADAVAGWADSLPAVLKGHWETAEGLDKAREYASKTRADLALSESTDLGLANALYLVSGELVIQTAAKERMRWLSVQLAISQAALKALLPEGWGDDDTMDHMPGVKLARLAIANAEGRP